MSRPRARSAAYRARRAVRKVARQARAAERAAAHAALEALPGYADMLLQQLELDHLEEQALDGCSDLGTGGRAECDEGFYCERHYREAADEHRYLLGLPRSAITGELSDEQVQDLRDAGRGHLVPP